MVRADGGVGINKNDPDADLDVSGEVKADSVKTTDLIVEGAYKGNIGPNNGAPFPRPAYDSGWVSINQDQTITLNHYIGGNIEHYVVDIQLYGSVYGRHIAFLGGDYDYDHGWQGVFWKNLSTNSISVKRYNSDTDTNQFRIRIWYYN